MKNENKLTLFFSPQIKNMLGNGHGHLYSRLGYGRSG